MSYSQLDNLLGLDGKYYSARKMAGGPEFYLQRRRQILLSVYSNAGQDSKCPHLSEDYLKIRKGILAKRFNKYLTTSANSSLIGSRRASFIDDSGVKEITSRENYAFAGMHHIFDQHRLPVTCIKFSSNDKSIFCCGSLDGTLSICQVLPDCKVLHILKGHTKGVTDFEWSLLNETIISTSLDCTARLWDIKTGTCLRVIQETAEILCCSLHPENNNLMVTGNAKNQIMTFNLSTGKVVPSSSANINAPVTSVVFGTQGDILFAGSQKGDIFMFKFVNNQTTLLQKITKITVSTRPITSLSFLMWHLKDKIELLLLISSKDDCVRVYTVQKNGRFQPKNTFKVDNKIRDVKSCFSPKASSWRGLCIVSGSENMSVMIFDAMLPTKPLINKLQGHSSAVLGVSWNFDESLLASSSEDGTVIVWKRLHDEEEGPRVSKEEPHHDVGSQFS